ncbi:MAG: hypothetical protein GY834_02055 [Bacteroidetes bacterium]|nr:hypothetical protein [Bacteroidota bacterium]
MKVERSLEILTDEDLKNLYLVSKKLLKEYFVIGKGVKWKNLYNIENPLAVARCQGATMHYHDKSNGIKDFDVCFFYPFKETHLPYRTIWN